MILGIDTSHWNEPVDWAAMKKNNIGFMSTKITEGIGSVDLTRVQHLGGAQSQGILLGGYHYFHPSIDGEMQALFFLQNIPSIFKMDWVALDLEANDNEPQNVDLSEVGIFLATIQNSGMKPWIYVGKDFCDSLGNPEWFSNYKLWVPDYGVKEPKIPKPWNKYDIWQYSDRGLDMNRFDGTIDQLKALMQ